MDKTLELINALIKVLGSAATLGDAKTWLEVEANAEALRSEGHDTEEV